jgi:hypothetical protein
VEIRVDPVHPEGLKGLDLMSFYAQSLGIPPARGLDKFDD